MSSRGWSGLGSLDNAESGLELWRLAVLVGDHPPLKALVLSGKPFEAIRAEVLSQSASRRSGQSECAAGGRSGSLETVQGGSAKNGREDECGKLQHEFLSRD